MLDREQRRVDLIAHLQHVAAVDEDHGAVGQHDRGAGRAGEAGEPGEPFLGGRHIFVLMAVGARHDEAVEAAALQFGAQRGKPAGARRPFAGVIERLQARFEHRGNLWGASRRGNRLFRSPVPRLYVTRTSVTHSPSGMRRTSLSPCGR